MSSLWYLAGDPLYYNLIARAFSIAPTPAMNPLFPAANIADGDPENPGIFGSLADVNGWIVDINQLRNPTLDAWSGGSPVDWVETTFGSGASVTETTVPGEVRSGSAAFCNCSNEGSHETAEISQERRFRSGERIYLSGWMRAGTTARSGQVAVLNKDTNRWLRIGSPGAIPAPQEPTWGEYQSLFEETGTVHQLKEITFQVEPYAVTLRDTCTLKLILKYNTDENGGLAGNAIFDDWTMVPAVNGVTVHGQNGEPGLDFNIYAGDLGQGALPMKGYGTVAGPLGATFYKLLGGPIYKRMWKLYWEKAPALEERFAGEVILGQFQEAAFSPEWNYAIRTLHPQIRNVTRGRVVRSTKDARFPERALLLPFSLRTSEMEELRQEWYERSWGGHHPMVAIPLDTDSVVVQGRLTEKLEVRRAFLDLWNPGDVLIEESPLPKVTK